jgi:hypothetical protein
MTRVQESVIARYLGFTLEIRERDVTVRGPGLYEPVLVGSVSSARRFARGYRRAERQETAQ